MRPAARAAAAGLLVATNVAAYWYLHHHITATPPPSSAAPPSATPDGSAAPEDAPRGPVLMTATDDGSLLRATRGDCDEGALARVWVASPAGPPQRVEPQGLTEALAVGHDEDSWWVIGADDDCEVTAWTAAVTGGSWRTGSLPSTEWYLDPLFDNQVISPRGELPLDPGCDATWVDTRDELAYVTCADGRALRADRAERVFSTMDPPGQVAALALRADGQTAELVFDEDCAARVRVIDPDGETVFEKCFGEDRAPLGISWAGRDLVAQIGFDLMTDRSGTWQLRD